MVLAISFIEAPVKFQAPGVTVEIGVAIGRLVFRVLNACEVLLLLAIAVALILRPAAVAAVVLAIVIAVLLAGCLALRVAMDRRVLGGAVANEMPRTNLHFGYIGVEVAKVAVLIAFGVVALN